MAKYVDIEPVFKQLTATVVTDDGIGLGMQMGLNRAMEILAKAPIIEAEPVVHAHWIPAPDIGDCCYRCSRCGKQRDSYIDEDDNYCGKCGAHMDKEIAE